MSIKLAIFDMDGTILDTLDDLTDGINYAMDVHGLPRHTRDEVRMFVGNGVRKLVERSVPADYPTELIDEVHKTYTTYYNAHCRIKTGPYEGIVEVIDRLRCAGVRCAVVSNKDDRATNALAAEIFPDVFDYVLGGLPDVPRKPSPESVNMVLDALGISAEESVYIGDSDVDIMTAKNSGMPCISVTWGFRDRDFLIESGATIIADRAEDIAKVILG